MSIVFHTLQRENASDTPWQIYPRPLMQRESYVNLNGKWDFSISKSQTLPQEYERKIILPFCPESALSGLNIQVEPGSYLFYRRWVTIPQYRKGERVILHIGAADQITQIYVNQTPVASHKGGYTAFSADITDYLKEENEIVIKVFDDLRDHTLPYGKQSLNRGGMWYTPVSGIWQTVWIECIPQEAIEELKIENIGIKGVRIQLSPPQKATFSVAELGEFSTEDGLIVLKPESPKLWTPESPYLYHFTVKTESDLVSSYFALRSIESGIVDGIPRLLLNGKPYFFHGLLDQGYWPDGIYTPANPSCYAEDILAMKKLGFNTLRKHIKVEPEEFYYQCDKLGMVVFQDMVNNGEYKFIRDTLLPTLGRQKCSDNRLNPDSSGRKAFLNAMEETVKQLKNHPCILYWTIFNEGWGQFNSDEVYLKLKKLDSGRIIDSTSGWYRRKNSDVESLHIYFGPWWKLKKTDKPLVLSEFGGHAFPVEGHLWNTENAYGYKTCKTIEQFRNSIETLYKRRILPRIKKGLCAAIITQVSDVEDEINGFLTYDRSICKAEPDAMVKLAEELQKAIDE